MKFKKNKAYFSLILFLISPFFSLPVILNEVYHRRKWAHVIFCCFIGILCYLYLPSETQDGARRYLLYEEFKNYDNYFDLFNNYIKYRADYIYYSLIYLFGALGIKFQLLLFLLGFFNTYIPLLIFDEIIKKWKLSKSEYFKFFFLTVLTFSLVFLFSAVRNNIAFSFLFLSFFLYYFKNKLIFPIVLYTIGLLTHFSIIIYLPILLLFKNLNVKYLFLIFGIATVISLIVPAGIIQSAFLSIELGNSTYDNKIEGYSYTEWGKADSTLATIFAKYLFSIWFYASMIYVFITQSIKRDKKVFNLYLAFAFPVVLTLSFPEIASRYLLGAKFVFVLLLISDYFYINNKKWQNIFIGLLLIQPLYDITRLLTQSLIEGFIKIENLSLIGILLKTYTYKDMLPAY